MLKSTLAKRNATIGESARQIPRKLRNNCVSPSLFALGLQASRNTGVLIRMPWRFCLPLFFLYIGERYILFIRFFYLFVYFSLLPFSADLYTFRLSALSFFLSSFTLFWMVDSIVSLNVVFSIGPQCPCAHQFVFYAMCNNNNDSWTDEHHTEQTNTEHQKKKNARINEKMICYLVRLILYSFVSRITSYRFRRCAIIAIIAGIIGSIYCLRCIFYRDGVYLYMPCIRSYLKIDLSSIPHYHSVHRSLE